MRLADFKVFRKFLARNKVYTFVTLVGFSVSLMFVLILGVYVKQELSVDGFHEKKERIYLMSNEGKAAFASPVAPYLKDNYPEVENFSRVFSMDLELKQLNDSYIDVKGLYVDSTFFNIFSFKLLEGDPSEVLRLQNNVVISRSFANRIFGNENPIGKNIELSDHMTKSGYDYVVTGIMEDFPANTQFPQTDVLGNYRIINHFWGWNGQIDTYNNSSFSMYVLESEGADIRAKSNAVMEDFKKFYWMYQQGFATDLKFIPLQEVYFERPGTFNFDLKTNDKTAIMTYMGIAILILVISLLNYINMTVAQAGFRGKEAALKKLMGARRRGIIVQMLVESLIVTSIAFLIGLVLALLAEPFFNNVFNTQLGLKSQFNLPTTLYVVGFVLLISIVAGFIPALLISGFKPIEVIKGTFGRKVKTSYSHVLVVFQYAVSIALLACTFFIIRQSNYLADRDIGLDRENIMIMDYTLRGQNRAAATREVLMSVPGVEQVAFSGRNPINSFGGNSSFEYQSEAFSFETIGVDSAFFKLFGIEITPTGLDIANSNNVIYLNNPGYNALRPDSATHFVPLWGENGLNVGGIMSDFHFRSLREPLGPMWIWIDNDSNWASSVIVKFAPGADAYQTARKVREAYSAFSETDRYNSEFVDDMIYKFYEQERHTSKILEAFTLLTILILIMGIFAMSIYIMRQKEKEIAIRKVSGSSEAQIVTMLNRQSIWRWLIAFVLACPVAYYAMARWLESFPYKTTLAWWVFAVAGLIILALNLLTVSWQSLRAARKNPVESLKGE